MADNGLVINDTSYAGTFASYFWVPATFGMDTVRKGAVYVNDGIKKKKTVGSIDFSNPLQPRKATPVQGSSQFTVTGRVLEPKDMMLYSEFNPRDYEAHWLAEQLSPTLLARELPVTAENYMMQIALNRTFEQIELGLWQGWSGYSAVTDATDPRYQIQYFDGFIWKFLNDATVKFAQSPAVLTTSNIGDAFEDAINTLTSAKKALLANPARYERLKFLVSIEDEQIYQKYLTTTLTFKGNNATEKAINKYRGYDVVAIAGLPKDTFVFCEVTGGPDSNLHVGMNSMEDNNLQLQKLQNNSELFFLKGLMKYDVQYAFGNQTYVWTTKTTNSYITT